MVGILLAEKALLKSPYVRRYVSQGSFVDPKIIAVIIGVIGAIIGVYLKEYLQSQS